MLSLLAFTDSQARQRKERYKTYVPSSSKQLDPMNTEKERKQLTELTRLNDNYETIHLHLRELL